MKKSSSRLHVTLAVLAPPRRFELLLLLMQGPERSVSALAGAVGLSQSCTTRHLQALAQAGLVKRVRDGKRVVFGPSPRDEAATAVLEALAASGAMPTPERAEAFLHRGKTAAPTRRRPRPLAAGAERSGRRRTGRETASIAPAVTKYPAPGAIASDGELHHDGATAGMAEAVEQTGPDSGNNTVPASQPRRWSTDLEDFLL